MTQPKTQSLVKTYNRLLLRHPLLVKSITGASLSSLGELISQWAAIVIQKDESKDEKQHQRKSLLHTLKRLICEPKLLKIFIMFCYGGLINAPINHFMYRYITQITNAHIRSPKARQLTQLLAALSIVSPTQVFFLISTLTVVNTRLQGNILTIWPHIQRNLKAQYAKILTSSCLTSTFLVSFAQKFIEPEKWSVFFSFAYAVLGTGQNIYLKLKDN